MANTAAEVLAEIQSTYTRLTGPPLEPFKVSDQFKNEQNHPAGIRAPHAIDALRQAQDVHRWQVSDGLVLTLALARKTANRPYAALVIACGLDSMGPGTSISSAWRLYGGQPEDPTDCLARLIEQFGLEVQVEGHPNQKFFASVKSTSGPALPTHKGTAMQISMFMRILPSGENEIDFLYAIDTAAYHQHVKANR